MLHISIREEVRGCGGWWDVLSKLDPGQRELWHQRWPLPLRSPGRWRRLIMGQREGGMKGQAAGPRGLLHGAGARVTLDWGNWSRQGCVSWLLGSHDVCFRRSSLPNRVLIIGVHLSGQACSRSQQGPSRGRASCHDPYLLPACWLLPHSQASETDCAGPATSWGISQGGNYARK